MSVKYQTLHKDIQANDILFVSFVVNVAERYQNDK